MRHLTEHVKLSPFILSKQRIFIPPSLWPPNSPDWIQ